MVMCFVRNYYLLILGFIRVPKSSYYTKRIPLSWKYTGSGTKDMWPRESTGTQFRGVGMGLAKLRQMEQNLARDDKNNNNKKIL